MSPIRHQKRDLRTSADLAREDIEAILSLSGELKAALKRGEARPALAGKGLAMIFEKPSLRTRCTFELGMVQLGGHAIYLAPQDIGLGRRESIHDVSRNLERWFDMVIARTFAQATVDELARHCRVPVINALSDLEHPCQAMADMLTLGEKTGDLKGFNLTYIGDGNNICHSLMLIGVKLGMNVTVSSPAGYEPLTGVASATIEAARECGGSYAFEPDPCAAVARAQAIYTDVWASMGQEHEAGQRAEIFAPYQVNEALVAGAPKDVLIMHDLPAHRGEEITDGVIDSEQSIVFDQAENRLHAQKGIMVFLDEASR
jgi:ornithine carbamoyltransferase